MTDHLSREQLLRYLDGELPKTGMRVAQEHLHSCWTCRTELERLEEDIATILDSQNKVLLPGMPPPPKAWPGLDPRLAVAAGPKRSVSRPMAYGLAVLTIMVAVFWLNSPRLSAKEALALASQADARRVDSGVGRFIRQKVRIRKTDRTSARQESSSVDAWRSAKGAYWNVVPSDAIAGDLHNRYRAREITDLPLSAASFQSWSKNADGVGEVSRDGDTLEVRFAGTAPRAVSFRIQPAGWRVTSMRLDFQDAEFEIAEQDFTVLSRNDVPSEALAHLEPSLPQPAVLTASIPLSEPDSPGVPAADPPAPNLDDVEMNVRFTLHQIGADLGEPIDVSRDPAGQLVVSAWGVARERQQLLTRLLGNDPNVTLQLQAPGSTGEHAMILPSLPAKRSVSAQEKEDEKRLADWFGSVEAQENFTQTLLSLNTELLARLYALKNLADRWPAGSQSLLSQDAQAKLADVFEDHARASRQHLSAIRSLLKPLLDEIRARGEPAIPPPSYFGRPWQSSVVASLHAAQEMDRLARALFTTAEQRASLNETAPLIHHKLVEANAGIQSFGATRIFPVNLSKN